MNALPIFWHWCTNASRNVSSNNSHNVSPSAWQPIPVPGVARCCLEIPSSYAAGPIMLAQHSIPYSKFNRKSSGQRLTLIVTNLPLGAFMKSSRTLSLPTQSTAVGKCSSKNADACSRVRRASMAEKGAKRVSVNDPS